MKLDHEAEWWGMPIDHCFECKQPFDSIAMHNLCDSCQKKAHEIIINSIQNKMTKTAKIEGCDFLKTFDSRNGLMYSYKLTMSNGEVGSINTKTENPPFLQPGQELMYASTSDKYGNKFTRIQPDKDKPSTGAFKNGQNWVDEPDRQKQIARQSSLKAAIDYYNCFGDGKKPSPQEIMSLADIFTDWVVR